MSIITQIITIIAIIIGATWLGIGSAMGKDFYDIILKDKMIKFFQKIKNTRELLKANRNEEKNLIDWTTYNDDNNNPNNDNKRH